MKPLLLVQHHPANTLPSRLRRILAAAFAWLLWAGLPCGLLLAGTARAQSPAGLPSLRYVAVKSNGADTYSFEPFASLASIADGARPLSKDPATWPNFQPRAIASDGDQWFAILRNGPSTCFGRYASYDNFRALRATQTRCIDAVADGYRGLAYDGKLFHTVFWDGGRHWWQSYRSWDDVVDRKAFHKQNDRRNPDLYRAIGYDPTQQSFFTVQQNARTLTLDRYATFSDMVAARPGIDRRSVQTTEQYAGLVLAPVNPTLEVYLVAGQSNAVGWDSDGAWLSPDPADAQIPFFYRIGNGAANGIPAGTSTSAGTSISLKPQVAAFRAGVGPLTNFGIEMGIGRTLFAAGRRNIALVKVAFGGTTLYADWNPQNPNGLVPVLQDNLSLASQQWNQAGSRTRLAGVFWMQGETDARDATQAAAYRDNLRSFISTVRAWSGNPQLPVVIGKVVVSGRPYADTVRAAQERVRTEDACTALVSADDLPLQVGDPMHFSAQGTYVLGQRMGEAFRAIGGC
jgi:hypothetical protein